MSLKTLNTEAECLLCLTVSPVGVYYVDRRYSSFFVEQYYRGRVRLPYSNLSSPLT